MKTTTADRAIDYAHDAVDKIVNATNEAAEALDERSEQFIDTKQQMVKNCRSYIQDNPITSLGIAVASGFLLGRLLSRR